MNSVSFIAPVAERYITLSMLYLKRGLKDHCLSVINIFFKLLNINYILYNVDNEHAMPGNPVSTCQCKEGSLGSNLITRSRPLQ